MDSRTIYLFGLLFQLLPGAAGQNSLSGVAMTDRYWDCCKPDCSWPGRTDWTHPMATCDTNNNPISDFNSGTGCGGGESYSCANQSPWAVNDTFSYGYASVFLEGHSAATWCCACYELTFTSGEVQGKKMIVQAHNSGFDMVTANRFSFAIPGGNTSYAGACAAQYGVPDSVFGEPLVGVASVEDCDNLPEPLQPGCRWRFEWFENAVGPSLNYTRIQCPEALTNRTGCIRADENSFAQQGTASRILSTFSTFSWILWMAAAVGGTAMVG